MRKKVIGFALCAVLCTLCIPAEAHQPTKISRIGYLSAVDPATESGRAEPIWLALRELGYIEGQNIAFEYRYAEGKLDRLPELAAELVRLKVDIIVVAGGIRDDPGGQECDQDDSYRYGGAWDRSCRGRPG
jgi:putative tryptophan/tyrosine transport system substrate-binding protein